MTTHRAPPEVRALGADLQQADDAKVLRVTAMLDRAPVTSVTQAILDPLRPRLAVLRPARPLRFARLLFLPVDPLIVPARVWRAGDPSMSRGAMIALSATVHAGLGELAREIDQMLADRHSNECDIVERAGNRLWPAAAAFLSTTPVPPPLKWEESGLPIAVYPAIAKSFAIVLDRACRFHQLLRDIEIGALDPDENSVRDLLRDLPEHPPEGGAMVMRLILEQIPHSAPILRRMITMSQDANQQRVLQVSLDRGMEQMFVRMEDEAGLAKELGQASVEGAGQEVRRLANLLDDLDNDPAMRRHKPRLKAIRDRVDATCQARFADGVASGLVTPLAAASVPVAGSMQTSLEGRARALRVFEIAARSIGGGAKYDAMLDQAARAVEAAGGSGALTQGRMVRLVEILLGPEAAEALYLRQMAAAKA